MVIFRSAGCTWKQRSMPSILNSPGRKCFKSSKHAVTLFLCLCLPKAGESASHLLLFSTQTTWGTKMQESSWWESRFLISSSSCATWIYPTNLCCHGTQLWMAPWTPFSLPCEKFPSHLPACLSVLLSVCPPQPASCCWLSAAQCRWSRGVHRGGWPRSPGS